MFAGLTAPLSPSTLNPRRLGRRLGGISLVLIASLLALPSAPANAAGPVATVAFDQPLYQVAVGETAPIALQVTVTDAVGAPIEGVQVTFNASTDAVTQATATLSTITATTNPSGLATVTTTPPNTEALVNLSATVDAVTGWARLAVRPMGYRPGEQLASVVGQDQSGTSRDIRTALQGGTWVLVDVCASWCAPCAQFTKAVEAARTELWTRYRIRLEMVTLLQNGGTAQTNPPSTIADAAAWKTTNRLSGNVYHAEGSRNSAVYRAAEFFTYGHITAQTPLGGFPTHLLVNPKGVIRDSMIGGQGAADVVARVATAAGRRLLPPIPTHDPRKPVPSLGSVTVSLTGQTATETFTEPGFKPIAFGVLHLDYDTSDPTVQHRIFGFATSDFGVALPAIGNLGLTLTQPKGSAALRLQSTALPTQVFGELDPFGLTYTAVSVTTTLPAITSVKNNTSVLVPVQALRMAMRNELEAGRYSVTQGSLPTPLTPEIIDTLVASAYGIDVHATFK